MPNEQDKPVENNIKRTLIVVISLICVLLGAFLIFRFIFSGKEDFWYCNEGEWKKHGNPFSEKPKYPCTPKGIGSNENDITQKKTDEVSMANIDQNENGFTVKIISPQNNELVSSVFLVTGEAPGGWFFEGSFPVRVLDENAKVISSGIASSYGEWMKEGTVPFSSELKIPKNSGSGWLVFQKDNPSDMRELDEEFKIPVRFGAEKNQIIKVFFGSNYQDPEHKNCATVFSTLRSIGSSIETARSSLEELLKGPNDLEKAGGFFTGINPEVKINSIDISDGIAKVDFDDTLGEKVAGSCLVEMIRSQITQTLKQFPTVEDVIISINGKTQDILQP